MKRGEKTKIKNWARKLSDEELEKEYYKSVYDCLGSQTEDMYELGYDIQDILEREKYEDYLCEYSDVIEMICQERGIELWKEELENASEKEKSPGTGEGA